MLSVYIALNILQDRVTVGASEPATVGGMLPPSECVYARVGGLRRRLCVVQYIYATGDVGIASVWTVCRGMIVVE